MRVSTHRRIRCCVVALPQHASVSTTALVSIIISIRAYKGNGSRVCSDHGWRGASLTCLSNDDDDLGTADLYKRSSIDTRFTWIFNRIITHSREQPQTPHRRRRPDSTWKSCVTWTHWNNSGPPLTDRGDSYHASHKLRDTAPQLDFASQNLREHGSSADLPV
ncbi:uncharacterized protein K489DRAFT_58516 [Dissoconium aciculare CBS 342.82]|uniref:Uncharacterized protein n=1 Tax=Dissoconium aciculare CBS 342.82 TaxID=1314786 RepID=A0A6J3LWU6_9PEZI|nr:uncharacterized protein K489DRAFT_58516 [Dissoconium aciculare CBS 342.82]KAF1819774.1 hypothetical protein K489DRAFT_58516 [Dissoconium aciculare CBS 342.82]